MEALSKSLFARRISTSCNPACRPFLVLSLPPFSQPPTSTHTAAALQAGTLLRGQPYLSELAWERGFRHGHQSYSLVGLIHTLAPPKVRELIGESLIAPVQPWDAVICTSPFCA